MSRSAITACLALSTACLSAQEPAPSNEILDQAPARARREAYVPAPGITIPEGPVALDWSSVKKNFKVPQWLQDGKFGIFIHWGPYTVPAHHNEWYARHMYSNGDIIRWHQENFGPQDKFGYKDFIPLFKAEKFNPDEWAELFKKAGAKYVVPSAEHHDRFAMWDSKLTKWDAMDMGPRRDIIGELSRSVRAREMKFGVSNHRMFGYDFMLPSKGLKNDLYDPAYADFYGPLPTEKSFANQEFCNDWLARNIELIDKYQPDFMWFDWDGTGETNPVKLQFAAYYFNRAREWAKEVAISQKGNTFPTGTGISSHEKGGRMPKEITSNVWMVDDVISDRSWSYVTGMKYRTATSIVHELIDATSKNGTMMLNISPRSDGVIPPEQQEILLAVGKWLGTNGEAIYSTRPWTRHAEDKFRFTTRDGVLYAISLGSPAAAIALKSLAKGTGVGGITRIELVGSGEPLSFKQGDDALEVVLPSRPEDPFPTVLKITGALGSAE